MQKFSAHGKAVDLVTSVGDVNFMGTTTFGIPPNRSTAQIGSGQSPYSAKTTDDVIICTCTTSDIIVNLPQTSVLDNIGRQYTVVKKDATGFIVSIVPFAGDLINGTTHLDLSTPNSIATMMSFGSGIWI